MKKSLIALFLCLALTNPGYTYVKLEGYFIAFESCEAFQSKNKLTNPGDIKTTPYQAYDIRGINKEAGDYFQIKLPDAPVTTDRWVHVNCGIHVVEAGTEVAPQKPPLPGEPVIEPPVGEESDHHVLALSWQPSFCEIKSGKSECKQLNQGLLPITEQQLSIHGLWPQPRNNIYCGIPEAYKRIDKAGRWLELPALPLDVETRELLAVAMPGTASGLQRHEWLKHGTCHKGAGGAEEYYDDTLQLTSEINQSVVAVYLRDHVGSEVSTKAIRAKFDEAFGAGAGERVQFHCTGDGGRLLIQELKINMRGVITPETRLKDLILAGDTQSIGCPAGVIDAAGLQ